MKKHESIKYNLRNLSGCEHILRNYRYEYLRGYSSPWNEWDINPSFSNKTKPHSHVCGKKPNWRFNRKKQRIEKKMFRSKMLK